jgi:hypothetical protein
MIKGTNYVLYRLKDMWMDLVTHVSQKEELNTGDLMVLLEK